MNSKGYALVNVLIVMALITGYEVFRYREYEQSRKMYTHLQNELLCYTMSNLTGNSHEKIKFNTGVVDFKDKKAPIRLSNGFHIIDWHKVP